MRKHNSTIRRTEKRCKSCGKSCYVFSKGRCEHCAKIEDTLARDERETEKVIQEEDLSGLIEDADTIFSQYIRLKYTNERGMAKCYTCPEVKHWTMLQNGHYVKRAHLYLRWDERNCKPQCRTCNEFHSGNMIVYREELEKESPCITDILYDEMRIVHKPSREEIRQIISQYTPLVKALKKKIQ